MNHNDSDNEIETSAPTREQLGMSETRDRRLPPLRMTRRQVINSHRAGRRDFRGVNLAGIDLSWVTLTGADFREANLTKACFRWARLDGVDLRGADLSGADLYKADLGGANLCGIIALRANFDEANLP